MLDDGGVGVFEPPEYDPSELLAAWRAGLAPDPSGTVAEWADANRVLPNSTSAEPGRYRTSRTPFLREIMENLSPSSPVNETIVMKAAQVGGSESGLNYVGAVVDWFPGSMMIVFPTAGGAHRFAETRLKPMIRLTPSLRARMGDPDRKVAGVTALVKPYPGGLLTLVGSRAAVPLRSQPVSFLSLEEVDGFLADVEGEGSAVDIVMARTNTFGRRYKLYINSTPTNQSTSIVYKQFQRGDRRLYTMPCPNCSQPMCFSQENFRHERGKPETAHMQCPSCRFDIAEARHKTAMLAAGRWVPSAEAPANVRSYFVPGFLSPLGWLSWSSIARRADAAEGDMIRLRTHHNTDLGIPFSDATDTPSPEKVMRMAAQSGLRARELPEWALFVAAGVDVGVDHVEIGFWAFGPDLKRHLVEHVRIPGAYTSAEVWLRLTTALERLYWHPREAVLRVERVFVDTGRFKMAVSAWLRGQDPSFATGIRGLDTYDAPVKSIRARDYDADGKELRRETLLEFLGVGVSLLKMELYSQISRTRDGVEDSPVSFNSDTTRDYAEQVTGEDYVTTYDKLGRARRGWRKRNLMQRVEALDTTNYARAAAYSMGWDNFLAADVERYRASIEAAARDLDRKLVEARRENPEATVDDVVPGIAWPGEEERIVMAEAERAVERLTVEERVDEAPDAPPRAPLEPKEAPAPAGLRKGGWRHGAWGNREATVKRANETGVVGGRKKPFDFGGSDAGGFLPDEEA